MIPSNKKVFFVDNILNGDNFAVQQKIQTAKLVFM